MLKLGLLLSLSLLVIACGTDETPPAEGEDTVADSTADTLESTETTTDTTDPDTGQDSQADTPSEVDATETTETTETNETTETADTSPDSDVDPNGECDPVLQDCESEGRQCDVRDGVPICVPTNPQAKGEDEACIGNDCAPGLTCIMWQEGAACSSFCDPETGDGCPEGKYCGANMRSNPEIGLCVPRPVPCDIFNDDCPEGQACGFSREPDTNDPLLACVRAGTQQAGDPGGGDNGRCARHSVCIRESEESSLCRQVCQEDHECTEPLTCSGIASSYQVPFCR